MPEFIIYEKKNRVAYITFNRSEVMNAINPPAQQEIWDTAGSETQSVGAPASPLALLRRRCSVTVGRLALPGETRVLGVEQPHRLNYLPLPLP